MGKELDFRERDELIAAACTGLLGYVGDSLYGACVQVDDNGMLFTWYVRPNMPEEELEDLQAASTEPLASYAGAPMWMDERFIEVTDTSKPLPTVGHWFFLRRGILVTSEGVSDQASAGASAQHVPSAG